MGCILDPELIAWFDYCDAWHKWSSRRPSRWHPIQYIKWTRSEPQCGKEFNK